MTLDPAWTHQGAFILGLAWTWRSNGWKRERKLNTAVRPVKPQGTSTPSLSQPKPMETQSIPKEEPNTGAVGKWSHQTEWKMDKWTRWAKNKETVWKERKKQTERWQQTQEVKTGTFFDPPVFSHKSCKSIPSPLPNPYTNTPWYPLHIANTGICPEL